MSYDFGAGFMIGLCSACIGVMIGAIVANYWRRGKP